MKKSKIKAEICIDNFIMRKKSRIKARICIDNFFKCCGYTTCAGGLGLKIAAFVPNASQCIDGTSGEMMVAGSLVILAGGLMAAQSTDDVNASRQELKELDKLKLKSRAKK